MSIGFQCAQCGKRFTAPGQYAGRKTRCNQCGHVQVIPAPERAVAQQAVDLYDLEEAEQGPAVPAPRPLVDRKASARSSQMKFVRVFFGTLSSMLETWRGRTILTCVGVAIFVAIGALDLQRKQRSDPGPVVVKTVPIHFPDRASPVRLEPGVLLYEVYLGYPDVEPGTAPGHAGKLWLYLPEGEHAPHSLPCVLIAGAGSILITGMGLADADRPEHLPYVRAGYAVLAFEMDGKVADLWNASDEELNRAIVAFLAAKAGLVNAKIALDFLRARVPEVDPKRIVIAGHSSAGTAALLVAEHEPRVKACIAYAPCIDLNERLNFAVKLSLRRLPGGTDFLTRYNPVKKIDSLSCPLFLFHAEDDSNVPCKPNRMVAEKLKAKGRRVTFVSVPSGGHYDSMIHEGIPAGMAWLAENGFAPARAN